MQLIDLSHTIEPGMPIFSATAPQPKIYPWLSHAQAANSGTYIGCTCEITEVRFLTSIGTYLDSPYHFHPEKNSIERLEMDQLVLPGVVVDCTFVQKRQPIPPNVLKRSISMVKGYFSIPVGAGIGDGTSILNTRS